MHRKRQCNQGATKVTTSYGSGCFLLGLQSTIVFSFST